MTSSVARDRVAVVVNGNAKQVTDDLVEILDQIVKSGDLFVSRSLEEGHEIAKTIAARGYPTVLTGGGDGTFVQMVTWIALECRAKGYEEPRFGLLRLGTGNALAWVLGAQNKKGRGVVADLARLRREGGERDLRLLSIEGTLTPFAGLGVDALAIEHFTDTKAKFQKIPVLRKFGVGGLAHAVSIMGRTMPEVLVRPRQRVTIINRGGDAVLLDDEGRTRETFKDGDVMFEGTSRSVSASTIPYWGFGARIFPFADDREDRFSLRVIDIGSVDVALNIRKIWRGSYRDPRVSDFLTEKVLIRFDEPVPLQVGGDFAGKRREVEMSLADPIRVVDYYAPPPVEP